MWSTELKTYALNKWEQRVRRLQRISKKVLNEVSALDENEIERDEIGEIFIKEFFLLRKDLVLKLSDYNRLLKEQSDAISNLRLSPLSSRDVFLLYRFLSRLGVLDKSFLEYASRTNLLAEKIRRERARHAERQISIKRPPGYRIMFVARFLYSSKSVNECFIPLLADWCEEYYLELNSGKLFGARMVSLRNYYGVIKVMIELSPIGELFELVRKFFGGN